MIKIRYFGALFVLSVGILAGVFFHKVLFSCVNFQYYHNAFYGVLAKELEAQLAKRGYWLNCPAILPQITISFVNIDAKETLPQLNSKYDFAVIGDCDYPSDIEYLKKFNALLVIDEYQNGYLSSFNLRTLHFKLAREYMPYCHTKYDEHNLDIEDIAQHLDLIIRGVLHEKF